MPPKPVAPAGRRGACARLARSAFALFNLMMGLLAGLAVARTAAAAAVAADLSAARTGANVGAALDLAAILVLWTLGALVLGAIALALAARDRARRLPAQRPAAAVEAPAPPRRPVRLRLVTLDEGEDAEPPRPRAAAGSAVPHIAMPGAAAATLVAGSRPRRASATTRRGPPPG